jgi:hypothetical protein
MNRDDLKLQRLLAAARDVRPASAEEMPPHLAGRVIAHWRSGRAGDDSWQTLVRVFRRALMCASVIMLFALAWGYDGLDTMPESDEAYANYELRVDVMP